MQQSLTRDQIIPLWPDATKRVVHLTSITARRFTMFTRAQDAQDFLRILGEIAHRHSVTLHEAACMYDHVHALVSFDVRVIWR